MVIALLFSGKDREESEAGDVTTSQKAITNLCQNTDYNDVCVESISKGNETNDPKDLIERAFQSTIVNIQEAAQNSTFLRSLEKDPRGKSALESCHELTDHAVNDLQRSLEKFHEFDWMNLEALLSDLKIWLSVAITYQETCIDGGGVWDEIRARVLRFSGLELQ